MSFIQDAYLRLFARPCFRRLNNALFHLSLHGLGVMNFWNDRVSGEEYFVHKRLPSLLGSRAPVVFDVGANVGNFSSLVLSAFPAATVHAFEPHPRTYERLSSRPLPPDRFKCHNCAVGDRCGTVALYDRAGVQGSTHASLYEQVISEVHGERVEKIDVPVKRLDAIAEREGIERIDFLKIDTEGHELAVLRGAEGLLRARRIGCVQFEFNEMNIVSRVFLRDFRNALGSHYQLLRLLPRGMLPLGEMPLETELFAYQNIIAVARS